MKTRHLLLPMAFFVFMSCHKEDSGTISLPFQAEVIGRNRDCGVFAIRFISRAKEAENISGEISPDGIYIARNLPEELQHEGIKLRLNVRKIDASEIGACTTMGISYPWIYVTKAVWED